MKLCFMTCHYYCFHYTPNMIFMISKVLMSDWSFLGNSLPDTQWKSLVNYFISLTDLATPSEFLECVTADTILNITHITHCTCFHSMADNFTLI